jgi:hypothetical protein
MADTSNVEELFLDVTEMNVLPTQIQFGADTWTDDEGFSPDDTFAEFYIKDESFYVRGFTATDSYTSDPGFYPATAFYVRGFSPTDSWAPSFYPRGGFYVRGFTPTDSWTPMFYGQSKFYVRNFTPTNSWSEFYVPGCA